jgi:hypothetical protein
LSLRAISQAAVGVLLVSSLISGINLRAPDLLVYAAGMLVALAVERLPWAAMLGRWTRFVSAEPAHLSERGDT